MYKAFATGTFNFRDLLRRGGPFESPLGSSLRPLVSDVFLNHNSHFLVGVSYDIRRTDEVLGENFRPPSEQNKNNFEDDVESDEIQIKLIWIADKFLSKGGIFDHHQHVVPVLAHQCGG